MPEQASDTVTPSKYIIKILHSQCARENCARDNRVISCSSYFHSIKQHEDGSIEVRFNSIAQYYWLPLMCKAMIYQVVYFAMYKITFK